MKLEGRYCRDREARPGAHADALWQAVKGDDRLWTYMSFGPFADGKAFAELAR